MTEDHFSELSSTSEVYRYEIMALDVETCVLYLKIHIARSKNWKNTVLDFVVRKKSNICHKFQKWNNT